MSRAIPVELKQCVLGGTVQEFIEEINDNADVHTLVDEYGQTLLHLASRREDGAPFVRVLLESNVPLDPQGVTESKDQDGWTPLHVAAWHGRLTVCEVLVEAGASCDIRNTEGVNPFAFMVCSFPSEACSRSHLQRPFRDTITDSPCRGSKEHGQCAVVRYKALLQRVVANGAEMATKTRFGDAPLHFAAQIGNLVAAEVMLENGAYVDIPNKCSETPLLLALCGRRQEMTMLLLNYDACPTMASSQNLTPINVAQRGGMKLVVHMMQDLMQFHNVSDGRALPWLVRKKSKAILRKEETRSVIFEARSLTARLHEAISISRKSKKFNITVESFVTMLVKSYYQKAYSSVEPYTCNWAAVLYNFMLMTRDVLSASETRELIRMLEEYCSERAPAQPDSMWRNRVGSSGSNSSGDKISMSAQEYCKTLLDYLLMHQMDPNNSLVGLVCREDLITEVSIPLAEMFVYFKEVERSAVSAVPQCGPAEDLGETLRAYPEISRDSLVSILKEYPDAHSHDAVGKQAIALGKLLRAHESMVELWRGKVLRPGDLAITLTEKHGSTKFTYYRYLGKGSGDYVLVATEPHESVTVEIHRWLLVPVPAHAQVYLGNKKNMDQMVHGALDRVLAKVTHLARDLFVDVLDENGISRETYDACMLVASPRLADAEKRLETLSKLEDVNERRDIVFGDALRRLRHYVVQQYRQRTNSWKRVSSMFVPTRLDRVGELLDLPVETLMYHRLTRLITSLERVIQEFEKLRLGIISGKEKEELTTWWLQRIDAETNALLKRLGYHFDALPHDYLSTPPANPDHVRYNYNLITEILDTEVDKHNLSGLVETVQNEVYPIIKQYVENAAFVISDILGIKNDRFSLRFSRQLFDRSKQNMESNEKDLVGNLISDLEYLMAAQELDEAYRGKGEQKKLSEANGVSHIVPISGLVIGSFCRKHNELMTAMEVWKIKAAKSDSSSTVIAVPSLHAPPHLSRRVSVLEPKKWKAPEGKGREPRLFSSAFGVRRTNSDPAGGDAEACECTMPASATDVGARSDEGDDEELPGDSFLVPHVVEGTGAVDQCARERKRTPMPSRAEVAMTVFGDDSDGVKTSGAMLPPVPNYPAPKSPRRRRLRL